MVAKYSPELTRKVIKSKIGNYAGLQPARYIAAKLVRNIRRMSYGFGKESRVDRSLIKKFRKDGYVSIENFLDKIECDSLKQEFDNVFDRKLGEDLTIEDGSTTVNRRGLGLNSISEHKLNSADKVVNSDLIWSLLTEIHGSHVDKKKSTYWFDVIENGEKPCSSNTRHTDVFYDAYKVWYFLDDVEAGDGPLVYYPSSHKFSFWRMKFEYLGSLPDSEGNINQPWKLNDVDLVKSGYKEKSFVVPANTLVIVNTHGFHRRGEANPGSKRRQVHFSVRTAAFN